MCALYYSVNDFKLVYLEESMQIANLIESCNLGSFAFELVRDFESFLIGTIIIIYERNSLENCYSFDDKILSE
jgi:hypothetical protein